MEQHVAGAGVVSWWRHRLTGLCAAGLMLSLLATIPAASVRAISASPAALAIGSSHHWLVLPFEAVDTLAGEAPTAVARWRPYAADSPWNTPIGPHPVYDPRSDASISTLAGFFGSNPYRYTLPVYEVTNRTPLKTITVSGIFSDVTNDGTRLTKRKAVTLQIPIPDGAYPAGGSDAQIVIWNYETGDEWGFWKVAVQADGTATARNGYHYNTSWSGVPPKGFSSRGAGVPYLAGLIRPWEIVQGHIDHAIAFAYDEPAAQYVYPATKSDGMGPCPSMPEGTRLQLDPRLTDADFDRWGLSPTGKIIARAMQQYGMIVVDRSGHPKIYAEYEGTAHWHGLLTASTVAEIPYAAFKVVKAP